MFKKSIHITVIFAISTLLQLINNIAVTRIFGANFDLDVFLAAVSIPAILVTVIYGTLNDAFLPLYGEMKIKNNKKADNYFVYSLFFLVIFSLIILFIFFLFSKPISALFYQNRGEEFVKNTAKQLSVMMFGIVPSVVATLFGAYYYFHKRFSRFPFAQLMGSVFNLLFIIIFYKALGVWSLVISFVLNIIFQIFFIIPQIRFNNFKIKNLLKIENCKLIIGLLGSWFPLILGNFALRSDILLIRSFGSQLPTGYLVYLNLITKIFSLAAGVITIGIQIVLLPHLVEEIANKNYQLVIIKVKKSKLGALFISFLIGLLLLMYSPPIIKLLFVGGKFTLQDFNTAISLLSLFFLYGVGWGMVNIFFQPLLALKKTWVVSIINLFSLIPGWGTAFIINRSSPLGAISWGLTVLLFSNIILAEIAWQYFKFRFQKISK